ncbi:hypothetical protein GALMADRAFT_137435 [Galerina marginata CBS 339.88]|uniref:F-box domain-containing protein n=1 Tax=Galerina marginata (strain CBS 339.88) TaxID=685588 RepID=A0A067TBA6_GALM3|nr:hypothetical protein GALMADRAFT_137435 [Galerina marginata CBS 339.88]
MFLKLPLDVTVRILLELKPRDLLACRLATKHLDNIVRDSLELQYATALVLAKAENNVHSNLPKAHKLQALQTAQKAWALARPGFSKSVPIPYKNLGASLHTGGFYFVIDSKRKKVHYFRLPSKEDEDVVWKTIKSEKTIVAVGPCVYEHDLLVLITAKSRRDSSNGPKTYKIALDLLELSTGNSHPQAQESCTRVMTAKWNDPTIGIEIIGSNLVLILSFEKRPNDQILIYDWQTGMLKTNFQAPRESYLDILFLTEHLMLLPNKHNKTLDVFRIPLSHTTVPPTPVLRLGLPALPEGDELHEIACRSEPSPMGAASRFRKSGQHDGYASSEPRSYPTRAFLASAEDAICLFFLRIAVLKFSIHTEDGLTSSVEPKHGLTFVVHRNALCALVHKYAKDNGEDNIDGMTIEMEDIVPWANWGPPITRWFNTAGYSDGWITTTAGQRYVLMPQDWSGSGAPIYVLDFNEENVRKMKKYHADREGETAEMEVDSPPQAGQPATATTKTQSPAYVKLKALALRLRKNGISETGPSATLNALAQEIWASQNNIETVEADNKDDEWVTDSDSDLESEPSVDSNAPVPTQWQPPSTSSRIWSSTEMGEVQPTTIFAEPVGGALQYVGCISEARYKFDGVLLDEERVIGLKISDSGNIDGIEILHFG